MSKIFSIRNPSESFGSVVAPESTTFSMNEGEVVVQLRDDCRGRPVTVRSARDAMALGVETINQDTSLVPQLLRMAGISKALDAATPVSVLSGGERQSIANWCAMQFASKLIFLDEPSTNLDVEETQGVLRFIKQMQVAEDSVLFITHNIHEVPQLADRAFILRQGEVEEVRDVADSDALTIEGLIIGVDRLAVEAAPS